MRFAPFVSAMLIAVVASAAHVDMNDPRRALGREDNIRIDAELLQQNLSPSSALSVTYQIENLTNGTIGVADRISDVTFDPDTATITFEIGAEVPTGATMPHVVTIVPGGKRVLTAGGILNIAVPRQRTPWSAVPRYVRIKVNVLRDVTPFEPLLSQQARSAVAPALPGDLFEKWIDVNGAVFLNSIPVRWSGRDEHMGMDVAERGRGGR